MIRKVEKKQIRSRIHRRIRQNGPPSTYGLEIRIGAILFRPTVAETRSHVGGDANDRDE